MGNGNHLCISHVGSSSLPNLILPTLLIVPELTKNLQSVSKLTKDKNVYMEFWPNHCNVKTLQGQTILRGNAKHRLYRLPHSTSKHPSMIFTGIRTSLHG